MPWISRATSVSSCSRLGGLVADLTVAIVSLAISIGPPGSASEIAIPATSGARRTRTHSSSLKSLLVVTTLSSSVGSIIPPARRGSGESGQVGPRVRRNRLVVAADLDLDQAVGPVGRPEDLAGVVQPERRQVGHEVVLVGRGQPHLSDRLVGREDGAAHLPQRLLQ